MDPETFQLVDTSKSGVGPWVCQVMASNSYPCVQFLLISEDLQVGLAFEPSRTCKSVPLPKLAARAGEGLHTAWLCRVRNSGCLIGSIKTLKSNEVGFHRKLLFSGFYENYKCKSIFVSFFLSCVCVCVFRATPATYGGSQPGVQSEQ